VAERQRAIPAALTRGNIPIHGFREPGVKVSNPHRTYSRRAAIVQPPRLPSAAPTNVHSVSDSDRSPKIAASKNSAKPNPAPRRWRYKCRSTGNVALTPACFSFPEASRP
jgi:hypothetical protein